MLISITDRQLSIILAALRDSQEAYGDSLDVEYPQHFENTPGEVTNDEIDQLCEHINCEDQEDFVRQLVEATEGLMAAEGGEPGDSPDQRSAWKRTLAALKAVKKILPTEQPKKA